MGIKGENMEYNKNFTQKIIKRVKMLCKTTKNINDLHSSLDFLYERISNIKGKGYQEKYDVMEILHSKTMKMFTKRFSKGQSIIFEFVKYDKVPNELLIIYNRFDKRDLVGIDMYKMKEKEII